MKDYVAEFESRISKIDEESKSVNIINAGVMNHGKSSLFNSLLDNYCFAAQDVRTTVDYEKIKWMDDVYLVDTPGLGAEESDDDAAFEAYRVANAVVFVHTVKVGELRKNELDAINKIKSLFSDDEFFKKHFCLVLTFMDSDSDGNIKTIRKKTLKDIENHCGIKDFKTFMVSNSRYQKGLMENKVNMIKKSGIPELRKYLFDNFGVWREENVVMRAVRLNRTKNESISALRKEQFEVNQKMAEKISKLENEQKDFLAKLGYAIEDYYSDVEEYETATERLEEMKNELSALKNRWNNERY